MLWHLERGHERGPSTKPPTGCPALLQPCIRRPLPATSIPQDRSASSAMLKAAPLTGCTAGSVRDSQVLRSMIPITLLILPAWPTPVSTGVKSSRERSWASWASWGSWASQAALFHYQSLVRVKHSQATDWLGSNPATFTIFTWNYLTRSNRCHSFNYIAFIQLNVI